MVWTYWKSTHKSYSWICNIPAQIANAVLKYCLISSSTQGKVMSYPLLLRSPYFLQLYFHPFPLSVASVLSKVGQMNLKQG